MTGIPEIGSFMMIGSDDDFEDPRIPSLNRKTAAAVPFVALIVLNLVT